MAHLPWPAVVYAGTAAARPSSSKSMSMHSAQAFYATQGHEQGQTQQCTMSPPCATKLTSPSTADRALPARPWVFVHDTYRLTPADLASLFKRGGGQSVRGTPIDVVALGLYFKQPVTRDHLLQARSSRRL